MSVFDDAHAILALIFFNSRLYLKAAIMEAAAFLVRNR
jgi:hypothetical protein